jgi:hypothetical protein
VGCGFLGHRGSARASRPSSFARRRGLAVPGPCRCRSWPAAGVSRTNGAAREVSRAWPFPRGAQRRRQISAPRPRAVAVGWHDGSGRAGGVGGDRQARLGRCQALGDLRVGLCRQRMRWHPRIVEHRDVFGKAAVRGGDGTRSRGSASVRGAGGQGQNAGLGQPQRFMKGGLSLRCWVCV